MQPLARQDLDDTAGRHLALIGAGALGSVYGARLASTGGRVTFVVRSGRSADTASIEVEQVGVGTRTRLQAPVRAASIPSDASAIALAVRADNLDEGLDTLLRERPSVPVISLTPLMPGSLKRLRELLGERLIVAMPGVVAYADAAGVIRYWLPRMAPTLVDDGAAGAKAASELVRWLLEAGIPARLHPHVDTMNPATTMTFLPLVLLLDAAGGTVKRALEQPALVKLALASALECKAVAERVGEVPRWAGLLGRFVGPRALRAGAALAQRTFPESVLFVEKHFGSKTHAQNVLLAREVTAIGASWSIGMPHTAELTRLCADRRHDERDA